MTSRLAIAATAAVALATAGARPVHADRIKDLATVQGVRGNALVGYGLVTGLAGTGDDSALVKQSVAQALKALGTTVNAADIKAKNVAAVMITAELPPFARSGQRIDVNVSSMGAAKSLAGGTLVKALLEDDGGRVWAIAQGPVAVGGFLVEAGAGTERKNHVTAARIPDGAIVEREAPTRMPDHQVVLLLDHPDFTTASRIATAIQADLGAGSALARDAGSVVVPVPLDWRDNVAGLVAHLEAIEANPDQAARVVVDERTGTVVIGGNVSLTTAAIAYGGLSVTIRETPEVSQPAPLGRGETKVVPRTAMSVTEEPGELHTVGPAASVADVASALNALGAKPRDLIAILQALVRAGALHAQLEVM
ncbi:MAG TPA: flagellar basal body P-ring protein FlgI [Kofleriaceae bacterium]|nr:flagellar basal body P-ring protein FlgI [Kofleriaceae bacterium]